MSNSEIETYCPSSRAEWRKWLEENHQSKQSVWLIYFKSFTKVPSLSWSEAVDEALCFGWIDSTKKTIDEERYMQYFSRRKPNSMWSKINKDKIKQLTEQGLMRTAGIDCITIAKQNGSWTMLDDVENLIIPDDLETAFAGEPNSKTFFLNFSKTAKKSILYWVISAKRDITRQKRIKEIVKLTGQNLKPKQFR